MENLVIVDSKKEDHFKKNGTTFTSAKIRNFSVEDISFAMRIEGFIHPLKLFSKQKEARDSF